METTKWIIDPTHSEIGFKVKHMMFTNVSGYFNEYVATATTDDGFENNADFQFNATTKSITTGNADRDNHLISPDFLDAENFPSISFNSKALTKVSKDLYKLEGDLTLKGITNPVALNLVYHGVMNDPWGNQKAGFEITGKINRKDWGLNWNSALEAGGVLVGEEVTLQIELQFIKQ
ncbi:YceI family protein [Flavobacterium agrisoli]|uniref:YceI family protein n=1 Tax=Flavobacterium agrisoli TaxID=2793066 RepID=A0A934PHV1_9FLAO|nr:YceI family protein [Flavobacterium agrisoli]MBK0368322.1 YceI family protein [Flavobacterium agrisoli]